MMRSADGRIDPVRSFRLSDEDYELLLATARAAGVNRSEMLRVYIRAGAKVLERMAS